MDKVSSAREITENSKIIEKLTNNNSYRSDGIPLTHRNL